MGWKEKLVGAAVGGPVGLIAAKLLEKSGKTPPAAAAPAPTIITQAAPAQPFDLHKYITLGITGLILFILFGVSYKLLSIFEVQTYITFPLGIILATIIFGAIHGNKFCIGILIGTILLTIQIALIWVLTLTKAPIALTVPIPILVMLFALGAKDYKMALVIVLLANLIFYGFFVGLSGYRMFPSSGLAYSALEGQQKAWTEAWSSLTKGSKTIVTGTQEEIRRQMLIATGDYEAGVEAQSTKPLGVFLEDVNVVDKTVSKTGVIDAYARLRAESYKTTIEGEPLRITLNCSEQTTKTAGSIRPQPTFTIEEHEVLDIDCFIPASKLNKTGSYTIALEAAFDFTTSAYLKSYFMDQETVRSYRRQGTEPLDAFQITDQNPAAIYTAGPMRIGMKAGKQPVTLIKDQDIGPTLTLTLERAWVDGQLIKLKGLQVTLPPGLQFESISGYDFITPSCTASKTKEQVCTFTEEQLKELYSEEDLAQPFKTIRIQTDLASTQQLLANAPLAIRSFKTEIDYVFRIKKTVDVTIEEERR
ncbi:tripartite tricarboxylate transporter TctB family protein [Candidatus Woesearchaeota archaeon]|nr:tripartite tricarboxylate transporter TctB family protein [Candidatus Woesearchaeota archaeon]